MQAHTGDVGAGETRPLPRGGPGCRGDDGAAPLGSWWWLADPHWSAPPSALSTPACPPSTPTWRTFLASTDHIVRRIKAATRSPVSVTLLEETTTPATPSHAPSPTPLNPELDAIRLLAAPPSATTATASTLLRRQIVLVDGAGRPLLYAASWWDLAWYARVIAPRRHMAISEAFEDAGVAVGKDVLGVHWGRMAEGHAVRVALADGEKPGEVWARHYAFREMTEGGAEKVFAVVCEVFAQRMLDFFG